MCRPVSLSRSRLQWHGANLDVHSGRGESVSKTLVGAPIRYCSRRSPWAITFVFVNLCWVLFRAPDVATAQSFLCSKRTGVRGLAVDAAPALQRSPHARRSRVGRWMPRNPTASAEFGWPPQAATALLLAAGILSVGNPTEFLYFNF